MSENRKHHIELLFSEKVIANRVRELAQFIANDNKGQSVTLIGILSGAASLTEDLGREIWKAGHRDVEKEYMAIESYNGTESSGEPRITKDTKNSIAGKHIVIVEDIVDTGYSMKTLLAMLEIRGAASIKVLALLSKPDRREVEVPIDYLGFEIPDKFVVGYNIDWEEKYRTLPYIGVVVFED